MARRKRTEELERTLIRFFDQQSRRVFREAQLKALVYELGDDWNLPQRLHSVPKFTAFLSELGLRKITLKSEHFRDASRYVWGANLPIYELALSIGKRPYLSHATAVFLHGLTDQIPKTIYVNDEQTPKNFGTPVLTQQGIDRAFAGQQRTTRAIFSYDGTRIVYVSGKWTNRLEVGRLDVDGTAVEVTKTERTLIDIAVRPNYTGGPAQVLAAYTAARDRISVNVLVATLKKLDYAYPYHQVIGFYMQRANYSDSQLKPLRELERPFRFYLTYGMKNPSFDQEWQLYIPKGF